MKEKLESRINALEMPIYRRIDRISKKKTIKYRCPTKAFDEKRADGRNKTRFMKYFGNIKTYNTIVEGKMYGRQTSANSDTSENVI